MLLILLITLQIVHSQPCTAPTQLIGTTPISGSCGSDVASTASTDFTIAALGGNTPNVGVTQFSISMWAYPDTIAGTAPSIYSLFRISTNAADTTPSTTNGVRLALIFQRDAFDSLKRGFQLAYSETPSSNLVITDIAQFLISYNIQQWVFIYAGVNYDTGDMKLFVWQTTQLFYKQQTYQASKVNFNTPLDANLAINIMYWGTYTQFCGQVQKVKWSPGYFETIDDNIMKLAFLLETKTNALVYLYRFDVDTKTTAINLKDSSTITLTSPMAFTYYEINAANRIVPLATTGVWSFADKSYTFGLNLKFMSLPVSGNNLYIFQRASTLSVNRLGIQFARQGDGTIGVNLVISAASSYLIFKQLMNQQQWYYLQISIAFPGCLLGQTQTLVHYHFVGEDGVFTNRGYILIGYTGAFNTEMQAGDVTNLGSPNNIYPNSIYIRNFRFQEGFAVFSGLPSNLVKCQNTCVIGVVTGFVAANNYCLICDTTSRLDSNYKCQASACAANFYNINDMVAYKYCSYCDPTQNYYVSVAETCIQTLCGNGFQEGTEACDDGALVAGDGCSATCTFEAGYLCNVVPLQLSTCVKLCGNGVDDIQSAGYPAYSEQCDDGNTVSNDGCSSACAIESNFFECLPYFPTVCTKLCGNGILNQAAGQTEVCDDGNIIAGDGCSATCTIEAGWECTTVVNQLSTCNLKCGNGLINPGEICDDGNLIPNDGCTNCTIDVGWVCGAICSKLCGNGTVDVANSEVCDDGNTVDYDGCTNCQTDAGWTCTGTTPTVCKFCGNGKREGSETCDDANTNNGDGCSSSCTIEGGWVCNGGVPDLCKNCGDGKKQQIENCDDGNLVNNDGCTNCNVDPFYLCVGGSPSTKDVCILQCPNGIVASNEMCDDGNNVAGDGCFQCQIETGYVCSGEPSKCSKDVCGNGFSNIVTEQCDDGNLVSGDGCSDKCQVEVGWVCVGHSYKSKSICTNICGDGKKLPIEECDDGNQIDGDGCSMQCVVELSFDCSGGTMTTKDTCLVTCGNNVRAGKEQCDDGNRRDGDGCSSLCLIESGYGCAEIEIQSVTRDECFKCVDNCAMCEDTTIDGCSLCFMGYYKSKQVCTQECEEGLYPDHISQICEKCGEGCQRCYNYNQCFNCAGDKVLSGVSCIDKCVDGYFIKEDELMGSWCKQCPENCTTCQSDKQCNTCKDYYSVSGVCKYCDLGDLCLGCDFETNYCTKCKVGYRPIEQSCLLITDKCGDGLVSLGEECDDGNIANDDGCSRECKVEEGGKCRLVHNEGPSECYDTLGWYFTLKGFILEPTRIQLDFSNSIMYDERDMKDYNSVFELSINGFSTSDYSFKFVNSSSSNITMDIEFTFLQNVVSQTLTVTVKNEKLLFNYYGVPIDPSKLSKSIELEDVEYYTDSQIDEFKFMAQIIFTLQIVNWILVVGAGFLGQQFRMWKIVEAMQLIAVLYYINLRSYPLNNNMVMTDLRYSNMYILPNLIEEQTDQYLDSLRRFTYAGFTHQVINNAGGRFLLSLAISIGAYFMVKIIYYRYILFVFEVFLDKLEFSYFFKLYEVFLLELLISCLHNIRFNSMQSDWDGTNTVIALMLLLLVFLIQVTQLLVLLFKNYFGTPEEVQIMFGTLLDGINDKNRIIRVFISQMDFIKKAFIAYAIIYVDDPFNQLLFIGVPRAVITIATLPIMTTHMIRIKDAVTELLIYGVMGMVYVLAQGSYIGDLDTKVFYGWIWEYLVLSILSIHFFANTYLVWKLLQDLETDLPQEVDPSAGLNKKVDLFRLKAGREKKALPAVLQEDIDKKVGDDEDADKKNKRLQNQINNKNKDREKWNVWDMDREARPEERKFVSINHNDRNVDDDDNQIEQVQPGLQDDIINFDELDQLSDHNNQFQQQSQQQSQSQFRTQQHFLDQTNNRTNNNNNNQSYFDPFSQQPQNTGRTQQQFNVPQPPSPKDDDDDRSQGIHDNPFDF